ncbi:MAG: alpha/beta hydrolase [Rhodospirillales bacterium]
MLEGFETARLDLGAAEIHLRHGGEGPPLLLLHGYPQTHLTWRLVAPLLARHFTLVMPDLRGYGASSGPVPDAENRHYAKRAMAADMVAVMQRLGHERFALAGHDRGGRVAYRLCLDHPERVSAFAAVDVVPTIELWEGLDAASAIAAWHWPFLAQPAALTEPVLAAASETIIASFLRGWAGTPDALAPEAMAAYLAQFERPSVIAATCADYRAGATTDRADDAADRTAGKRIACPILTLWGRDYIGDAEPTPVTLWRRWADRVEGHSLPCGHFLQEEAPDTLAEAMIAFFLANPA